MCINGRLFAAPIVSTLLLIGCTGDEIIGAGVQGHKLSRSIKIVPVKEDVYTAAIRKLDCKNENEPSPENSFVIFFATVTNPSLNLLTVEDILTVSVTFSDRPIEGPPAIIDDII